MQTLSCYKIEKYQKYKDWAYEANEEWPNLLKKGVFKTRESMLKLFHGCSVKKGDTICIVEAMKIMNEIEAEVDGVIEAIHTANGQAIEYDQPLVTIKPAS